MLFSEKQTLLKRNTFREQTGGEFDTEAKQLINAARKHIAREARWRNMRVILEQAISTTGDYTTGTCTFTNASAAVTAFSSSPLTQGVEPGQRIKNTTSGASGTVFQIKSVDSATQITLDRPYDGTTGTSQTYKVLGKERYTLPVELAEISFIWHEDYDSVYVLDQVDERDLHFNSWDRDSTATPTSYYIMDPTSVDRQPSAASTIRIVSSSNASGDQSAANVVVLIEGIVSGVPDREEIVLNGTTAVDGSKSFTSINRITKTKTTTGRVTVSDAIPSAGSGATLATLAPDLTYQTAIYTRIGLNPLPDDSNIILNVWGYRQPKELVNDNDISEWGPEFDMLEVLYASYLGNIGERQPQEADRFFQAYLYELSKLKARNTDRLDFLHTFKRSRNVVWGNSSRSFLHPRLSYRQFGPNYGPGVHF